MTKRLFVQVRVSEGERAAFGVAAGAAGLSVSEWLRRVCLRAAGEGLPLMSSGEWRESVVAMSGAQLAASRVVREAVEEPESPPEKRRVDSLVFGQVMPARKSFKPDFK